MADCLQRPPSACQGNPQRDARGVKEESTVPARARWCVRGRSGYGRGDLRGRCSCQRENRTPRSSRSIGASPAGRAAVRSRPKQRAVTTERSWLTDRTGRPGDLVGRDVARPDQVVHTIDVAIRVGCHIGRCLRPVSASHHSSGTGTKWCRDHTFGRRQQRSEELGVRAIARNRPTQCAALNTSIYPPMCQGKAEVIPVRGNAGADQVLHAVAFRGRHIVLMPKSGASPLGGSEQSFARQDARHSWGNGQPHPGFYSSNPIVDSAVPRCPQGH